MTSIYSTGTVSVTNGNAVVTGSGTAWAVALVTGGSFSCAGMSIPILSVEGDTSLTLAYPWPGATAAGAAYAIQRDNSDAANVVDLFDKMSRVLVQLGLAGIHPSDSGTIADRDALTLGVADKGFIFLYAQPGFDLAFYRWSGTAWQGPFDTRGVQGPAGVGAGGLGLPAPGSANKFPYYTAANTVTLGDITAAGRAILDDADASAQLTTLGFSAFIKTLIDDADASAARATLAALGGGLGGADNRLLRADGTGGATAQGSVATLDDSGNLAGIAALSITGVFTLNQNSGPSPAPPAGIAMQIIGADGGFPLFMMDTFGGVPTYLFRRANGTSAAPSAVLSGNPLGTFAFRGYGASAYTGTLAQLRALAAEDFTASAQGTKFDILSTPIGSTSPRVVATFGADGSFTPIGLLDLSGSSAGQIKFPSAQNPSSDANTFDDYKEGTFTPLIIGTGTAGAGTYSTQVGHYVKMGCRVDYDINLTWSAHTGTTNMKVSGLPYIAGNRNSPAVLQCSNLTFAATLLQAYVEAAAATISLGTVATGAAYTALPIDTAATLNLSGSYSVI